MFYYQSQKIKNKTKQAKNKINKNKREKRLHTLVVITESN